MKTCRAMQALHDVPALARSLATVIVYIDTVVTAYRDRYRDVDG